MANTHDYSIANDTGSAVRTDLNTLFTEVEATNAGATAPANLATGKLWYDTANSLLKQYDGSAWVTIMDSTGGTFTGAVTLPSPVINTGVSGSAVLDSDTMSGATATTISSSESIKAYVDSAPRLSRNEGLVVKYTSATTVDIDADYLTVFDSNSYGAILPAVNLTATITSSGANGLDTGSEAAIWYHIYVIYNGTTVASLLSASATSPTMPSGYTYKKYVGAVYNPSSSFRDFRQFGNNVSSPQASVSTTNFTTSWVTRDYSAWVPTTAKKIKGQIRGVTSSAITVNISIAAYGSGTGETGLDQQISYVYLYNTTGLQLAGHFNVMALTAQTIYVKSVGATQSGTVTSSGWSYENIV